MAEQTAEAQAEQALAVAEKEAKPIRVDERGLAFESAAEVYRTARAFVADGVAPSGMTPGAAMAAILKGRALGLDEITSLTNITVVKGRVQIGGAVILALLRKNRACAAGPDYWWEGEGNSRAAYVQARRVDELKPVTHRFGMEEAIRAGLAAKDNYKHWTDDMLLWRAVGRMGRRQFPDVLAGVYVPGEIVETAPQSTEPVGPPPGDPLLDELAGAAASPPEPAPVEFASHSEKEVALPEPAPPAPPFPSHAEADAAIAAQEQTELFKRTPRRRH